MVSPTLQVTTHVTSLAQHSLPAPIPTTRYRTILADPPWDVNQRGTYGAIRHYPLMSLDAICNLRVDRLAADDAHLWLWVTNAALHAGHQVIQAWGFTYRSCLTWIKPRFGLGNYLRNQTEHLLLGTRGKAPILFRRQGTWLYAPYKTTATNPKSNTPSSNAAHQAPTSNYSHDTNNPAGTHGETTSPAT